MRQAKVLIFFLFFLFSALFSPASILAENLELTTIADSFVNDGYTDRNYGGATLTVSHDSVVRRAFVKFNLNDLPEEATVNSAILKLYLFENSGDASAAIRATRALGSWAENEINWNNQPSLAADEGVVANIDEVEEYKNWDITEIVRGWQSGDFANYGFVITGGTGTYARSFHSKEYWGNAPLLVIDYSLPENTPTPTSSPTPTPTESPQNTPTVDTETSPSPTPEPSITGTEAPEATPATATGKGLKMTTGQTIIIGLILLALIGALGAFLYYQKTQPKEKKPLKEKNKKEKETEKKEAAEI